MIQHSIWGIYKFILEDCTLSAGMSAFFTHQRGTLPSGIPGALYSGMLSKIILKISLFWSDSVIIMIRFIQLYKLTVMNSGKIELI